MNKNLKKLKPLKLRVLPKLTIGVDFGINAGITLSSGKTYILNFENELYQENIDKQCIKGCITRQIDLLIQELPTQDWNITFGIEDLSISDMPISQPQKWFLSQIKSIFIEMLDKNCIKYNLHCPRLSSQLCWRCGYVFDGNREYWRFSCRHVKCDYQDKADVNAAKNFATYSATKLAINAIKKREDYRNRFHVNINTNESNKIDYILIENIPRVERYLKEFQLKYPRTWEELRNYYKMKRVQEIKDKQMKRVQEIKDKKCCFEPFLVRALKGHASVCTGD